MKTTHSLRPAFQKAFGLTFVLATLLLASAPARAQGEGTDRWGLGIIVGEPVAITGQRSLGTKNAFTLGFGYSWGHSVFIYADYLFKFPHTFDSAPSFTTDIVPYMGVGGLLALQSNSYPYYRNGTPHSTVVGVRVPFGLECFLVRAPVQFFVEIVPVVVLVPGIDIGFNGGVGVRYFF